MYDVLTFCTKFLKYDIELTLNWKHSQCPVKKQLNPGTEGPRCIWYHGLLLHIHPWLLFWITVKRNVLQKHHKIEGIKHDLWINTTFSLWQWDELYLKAWLWLKSELPQGYMQFNVECDFMQYDNKVETIVRIHLRNLLGENNFGSVQRPSQNDRL